MIAPYTEEGTKPPSPEDVPFIKATFSGYVQDGQYNAARDLMDEVRQQSVPLADELYQIALIGHNVVLD
jgi:hypothetical protein